MIMERYNQLEKISIEDSGIIKCSMDDSVYKFCVLNKIYNLGDFVYVYKNKRLLMDGRYNINYFDGVIDLINFVFFDDKLPEARLLSNKIKIFRDDNNITHCAYTDKNFMSSKKNASLRRLGFNNEESKALLSFVVYLDKEMSIITAIKLYLENLNFKKLDNFDEMFITKLQILNNYYDNNKKEIENVSSYDLYCVEEKMKKLNDLYSKRKLIDQQIIEVLCEVEEKIDKLPQNEESVKKLIKKYQQINCK